MTPAPPQVAATPLVSSDEVRAPDREGARLARAVISNTGAQLISHAMTLLAAVGTSAMLSRYLGPTGFGTYAVVFSYVGLVSTVVADWGLGPIAAREASQSPDDMERVLASAAGVQCIAAGVAYAVLVATGAVVGGAVETGITVAGLVLLLVPLDVLAIVLTVRLQMGRLAWLGVVAAVVRLALTAAALVAGADLLAIIWMTTLASFARYALLVLVLRRSLRWRHLRPRRGSVRPLLTETWPVGLATTCLSVMTQVPVLLLDRLATPEQVGYFSAGTRITLHVGIPAVMLAVTLYPIFSRLAATDQPALGRMASQLMRYLFILALPLTALGLVVGPRLMVVLYGDAFAPAAAPFAVLMGQVAVLYPCTIAAHILIALGRQRADLAALAAGAAVVVVGCVVLDGAFGSTGAAVGLLAGSLVAGAAMLVAIRRYLGTSLSIPGWRLLAAACVLIGVTAAVHVAVALEVAALVGIAAYLIAAFLFGCLTRADIVHMVEIVRSRRSRRSNAA